MSRGDMGGCFCVVDRQVISELCSWLFGVMRLGENGSSFELEINYFDGGHLVRCSTYG